MKLSPDELFELTTANGGKFAVNDICEATKFCRELTVKHYENFPVASILLPQKIRQLIYPIYAFARIADDISDELIDIGKDKRINVLEDMSNLLAILVENKMVIRNPVFIGLKVAINEKQIPIDLFNRLLTAFKMDIEFKHPQNFDDLLNYCYYSANPIGELILRLFDDYNDDTIFFSEKICTGLQIINFLQDLSIDIPKGRCYIPLDYLENNDLTKENLFDAKNSSKLKNCIEQVINKTEKIFCEGFGLINRLKTFRLRLEIAFTLESGNRILNKSKDLSFNLIKIRPKLKLFDFLPIMINTIIRHRLF